MFFSEAKKRYVLRTEIQILFSPSLWESYEKGAGAVIWDVPPFFSTPPFILLFNQATEANSLLPSEETEVTFVFISSQASGLTAWFSNPRAASRE